VLRNLKARCLQLEQQHIDRRVSSSPPTTEFHVALFYGYVGLDEPIRVADEQRQLCQQLHLRGRLLIANEGFNGTLSGTQQNLHQYIDTVSSSPIFRGTDWKLSTGEKEPFPDLAVRVVKEIVNTGGLPVDIGKGGVHLSPQDFHDKLLHAGTNELVLLDVRNTFEVEIGHFQGENVDAISPQMKSFSQFGSFARANVEQWKGKQVLMYCTGGIRCEKASAYIKQLGISDVGQLSGGIHRYLEEFGGHGLFKGRNFVFDQRVSLHPPEAGVVGRCFSCDNPFDELCGSRVCAVCRDLVLACDTCQEERAEYLCREHSHLRGCYFYELERFTDAELRQQFADLQQHYHQMDRGGKSARNRRRTLMTQIERIQELLQSRSGALPGVGMTGALGAPSDSADGGGRRAQRRCRTCGDKECNGIAIYAMLLSAVCVAFLTFLCPLCRQVFRLLESKRGIMPCDCAAGVTTSSSSANWHQRNKRSSLALEAARRRGR
jgi:predicted sulfurtransferase